MARANYSAGKRKRELDRAQRNQEKQERLRRNRERGPREIPIASAAELQPLDEVPRERNDAPVMRPRDEAQRRLFIGGLSWDTNEAELRQAFGQFGELSDVAIILDRDTGRSRGFGFVTYAQPTDAKKAMSEMDGAELDGRRLKVTIATDKR